MKFLAPKGKKTLQNKEIPATSGIYFFFSKEKDLIYIGKSTNLRRRVAQHFGCSILALDMVNSDLVHFVSFIETPDEFDALRLEKSYLQNIQPHYNVNPFYQQENFFKIKFKGGIQIA